jgi:hypothetical protein
MLQVSTVEHTIEQNIIRYPKFILTDREHRRHEIAVEDATGEVVGYTRWALPEIPDVRNIWASARVADVDKAVEEEADADAKKSDISFDQSYAEPLERVAAMRKVLFDGKGYLRESSVTHFVIV